MSMMDEKDVPMGEKPAKRNDRASQLDQAAERVDLVNEDFDAEYTDQIKENTAVLKRKTRFIQYTIECQLCDQPDKVATRYPGGVPTICDDCYYSYGTPQAARSALKDRKNPQAAAERKKRYATKLKARRAAERGSTE